MPTEFREGPPPTPGLALFLKRRLARWLGGGYGHILSSVMAVLSVKATYSLDPETVRNLEDMARRWGVSKSEALRRAIRSAAGTSAGAADPAIRALDALQRSLALDSVRVRT